MIKNNANRQAMAMAVAEQAKELGFAITPEGASNDDITQRVYCLILESSPACRLTPSIAVCVSMKPRTASQSRPLLDSPLRRTEMLLRAVRVCGVGDTGSVRKTNRLKRKDLRSACVSKSQVFV